MNKYWFFLLCSVICAHFMEANGQVQEIKFKEDIALIDKLPLNSPFYLIEKPDRYPYPIYKATKDVYHYRIFGYGSLYETGMPLPVWSSGPEIPNLNEKEAEIFIKSDSREDRKGGTGASKILIWGILKDSYELDWEIVHVDGLNEVPICTRFYMINGMKVLETGDLLETDGTIRAYFKEEGREVPFSLIPSHFAESQEPWFFVPKGFNFVIQSIRVNVAKENSETEIQFTMVGVRNGYSIMEIGYRFSGSTMYTCMTEEERLPAFREGEGIVFLAGIKKGASLPDDIRIELHGLLVKVD